MSDSVANGRKQVPREVISRLRIDRSAREVLTNRFGAEIDSQIGGLYYE
jgi:hypothetical protein